MVSLRQRVVVVSVLLILFIIGVSHIPQSPSLHVKIIDRPNTVGIARLSNEDDDQTVAGLPTHSAYIWRTTTPFPSSSPLTAEIEPFYQFTTFSPKHINLQAIDVGSSLVLTPREKPLQHIAFTKTHKCASSTIQNMLMRYGLTNNLTFILPKGGGNHIGWPSPFDPAKHMRNVSKTPNIFCYHSVYSSKIATVMPEDTFYLAAVRDPFTQLHSAYVYYNWYKCSKKNLSEIASNISPNVTKVCGTPLLNPVIYDLGFPFQSMTNSSEIERYILETLDQRFDLVMVVDYFDESLIILRDKLGWTNDDILSFAVNFRQDKSAEKPSYPGVDLNDTLENRKMVYDQLEADTKLYLHFRKKIETIINANKEYIFIEKEKLREARLKWMEYCIAKSVSTKYIKDGRFRTWGNAAYGYVLTENGLQNQTCIDLAMAELPFVGRINKYQPAAT